VESRLGLGVHRLPAGSTLPRRPGQARVGRLSSAVTLLVEGPRDRSGHGAGPLGHQLKGPGAGPYLVP